MSLTIRPLTHADLDAANALSMAAYGGPVDRRGGLARTLAVAPDGLLLAECDGAPAGVGSVMIYGPFAWIGAMAVAPELQRRGIAAAIMERLLAYIADRRCPLALLDASAAGEALYRRLGFVEDDVVHRYQLPHPAAMGTAEPGAIALEQGSHLPWATSPSGAARASGMEGAGATDGVAPLRPADLDALAAFDAPLFGGDRRALIASLLADFPDRAWLHRDRTGAIDGYLIAQTWTIGPWMATDPAAAAALFVRAMSLPEAADLGVMTPGANEAGLRLLERSGLTRRRTLRHMRLGAAPSPQRRAHIWGQASFGWG